jgi:hypothetical protein
MKKLSVLILVLLFTALAGAQMPVPAPPRFYVDTTWNPPTGGAIWRAHTTTDFTHALNSALPGDTIVLDAGSVYTGTFTLPAKMNPNNKWIYIESSALAKLPAPGTRVSPGNASNMPKITTLNTTPPVYLAPGASHYRLVGLEIRSDSTVGGNPTQNPPSNNWSYYLIQTTDGVPGDPLVNSVTFDRIYAHGSDTQDVIHAVNLDGSSMAIVDSYISDIHMQAADAQGILVTSLSPGPYKIVDNYISASTENVMFSPTDNLGTSNNPYLPSDIEIRNNWLYKPTTWDKCGAHGTLSAGQIAPDGSTCPAGVNAQWVEKNSLEFKIGQRAVVTGNTLENTWLSGQVGWSLVLTVRPQNASNLWISDILFQSNLLKNVDRGINTLEQTDNTGYSWHGYNKRVRISNNLILLATNRDVTHFGILLDGGNLVSGYGTTIGLTDYIFQHNTVLKIDGTPVDESIYFSLPSSIPSCDSIPAGFSATHNVWILDNALSRQPTGDCGFQGTTGLTYYMGDPAPLAPRFYGDVMFVPVGDRLQSYPVHNYATMVSFTYLDPTHGDYQLAIPDWTDTTDGQVSGIGWNSLQAALGGGAATPPPVRLPPAVRSPLIAVH